MPSSRAKEVFLEALGHPAGERTAIVLKACDGDASLRAQVEDLFRVHGEAGQFMSRMSSRSRLGPTPFPSFLSEKPGTIIGRFKLLQQIGEGGFGVVYMAEQEQPVRRKVALKIIKLGMDTRQVIARFEAERQALALMDHPHIAKVLDAGSTDTGRPYFVMELVKGVPITHYCDQEHVALPERLSLFLKVCGAVQHAHQKGVIHRDIKPSNILVTLHDGTPVPKVIDFGIAKATEQKLTERTMFTEYGQFIGTPAYMSPEQAEMSGLDVDTRSDIYSLGVLLYELLTSSLPFDPQRLLSAERAEMVRIIREEEPHRPSMRLRTLAWEPEPKRSDTSSSHVQGSEGDSAKAGGSPPGRTTSIASIAQMRHTDPQSLMRTVRGDLDWIVMKCLEKDRTRRYETANGLARDVARFLAGETVSAVPPSAGYRFRKFVRRNRAIVTMGTIVLVALVLGLAAAMAGFVRAREQGNAAKEQRQLALQERDKARDYAEELRHELYASKIEKIQRILATDSIDPVKSLLAECDQELRGWEWDRLNFLADRSTATVQAAGGPIHVVKFADDGSVFMTASTDSAVRVWNSQSLQLLAEMKDDDVRIGATASLSLDGRIVITTDGARIHMWDARRGLLLRTFAASRAAVHALALDASGSHVAVGYWDGGTEVYDLSTGAPLLKCGEKASSGRTVAFSRDGKRIVAGSIADNNVSVCSAADGSFQWAKRGAAFVLLNAVFSPDDELVATVGLDSRLWVRKSDTGELVYTVATGKGASSAVAFHPDGTLVAVGGLDGLISFFRTSNGEKLYSLHGHEVEVTAIAFDPSGRFLISGARDGSIKKWHLGSSGPQVTVRHTHVIGPLAFSPDDKHLWAIGGGLNDFQCMNLDRLKKVPLRVTIDNPTGVAVSPDGTRLAVLDRPEGSGYCTLFDDKFDVMYRWQLPGSSWGAPVFSPDGRWLVVSQWTGELSLFDTLTGAAIWKQGTHREDLGVRNPVLFSSDGASLLNGSREGTILVLATATGELLREFSVTEGPVGPLILDSSGDRLFSGGVGKIDVWDWRAGRLLMTMVGHNGQVNGLALLPDESRVVSAGSDATVRLWELPSGRQVMVVGRHDGSVISVSVSHDGSTIATGGEDNSLRLWETRQPSLDGLDARYERARPTWVGYHSDD